MSDKPFTWSAAVAKPSRSMLDNTAGPLRFCNNLLLRLVFQTQPRPDESP